MAANSLLYLLLSTGLTVPPNHSVTTESNFDQYTRRPSYGLAEDVAQWQERTRWPGYAEKQQDAWKEDTENPFDQFTAPPVTEENAEIIWPLATEEPVNIVESHWEPLATEEPVNIAESHWEPLATEEPVNNAESRRDRPYTTEEPLSNAEILENWPHATEEPERPQSPLKMKSRKRCPRREHYTRCHRNCEKTCENYKKRPYICPAECKPGCVCDGGLVRNREGKCVMRQQCEKRQWAMDDDSHGCPYEFTCDVHCVIEKRQKRGACVGDTCRCYDR